MSSRRERRHVLIAPDSFEDGPSALEAAQAICDGLSSHGWICDLCPLGDPPEGAPHAEISSMLDAVGWDQRMRGSRAVVTATGRIDRHTLTGSLISELATRARQAGVPCYAIVGEDALDAFDKRVLDLDVVIEASTIEELERAGAEIAALLEVRVTAGERPGPR